MFVPIKIGALVLCLIVAGCVRQSNGPSVTIPPEPKATALSNALWAKSNGIEITPAEQAMIDEHESQFPAHLEARKAAEKVARELARDLAMARAKRVAGKRLTPAEQAMLTKADEEAARKARERVEICKSASLHMLVATVSGSDADYAKARDSYERCEKGGTITIPARYSGWIVQYCDMNKQVINAGRDIICAKK